MDLHLLGTSIHSVEDAKEAERLGADYIFAGNIFETDCKKGLPGRGLEFLENVCKAVNIPVYAIGGISEEKMPQILGTGAAGGCMMSGFMQLKDMKVIAKMLLLQRNGKMIYFSVIAATVYLLTGQSWSHL